MIDAVKFMLSDQDEISWFKGVYLVFRYISGISGQKQEDFLVIVIVELKTGVGGGGRIGLGNRKTGFHGEPP